jgi:hypothetical protein
MSQFHSVINEFNRLTSLYGFKALRKLWYSDLVVLSKHLEGYFYCYIIARVYRHNGALETTLWVGPVDRPDDGLEALSAHIKLQIGYDQTLNTTFFHNCESRIIHLIEADVISNLVLFSSRELQSPSIKNERHKVYTRYFLPLYQLLLDKAGKEKKVLLNKKGFQILFESVYADLEGDLLFFCEDIGKSAVETFIWEMCYIYAIT